MLASASARAQGAPLLTLADTTLFPEGIVRDGALFAASAALPPMLRYTAADTLRAEVLEFDLASGALRRRIAQIGRAHV